MPLPINISELLNGHTVEWDRLEFKAGWNPEDILHTICAFANDINNWGGGYIIVGIEEKDGLPILPPKGLNKNELDLLQRKLIELTHQIDPYYTPVTAPVIFQEKHIFVIWVPGGETRPYKAPVTLGIKAQKRCYIRRGTKTILANSTEEIAMLSLAAKVPFDDRINHQANINDLRLHLIQSFLQEVGSDLYEHSSKLTLEELASKMQIARGSNEFFKPLNVGLLFFNERPDKFFRGSLIEVIIYDDEDGVTFIEKQFTGPLHYQLRESLAYIKTTVIEEHVRKISGQAEALRFYNYPYQAIEEALANAVYHKSYEHPATIEVNIRFNRIEILSFPGPLPPITNKNLKQQLIVARNYRNRRIGDFLKEIHLTEGRSTGIPTIYKLMRQNGSPEPVFETDDERNYFLSTLMIHPLGKKNKKKPQTNEPVNEPVNEPANEPANEPVNEPVNSRQKEIIRLIKNNKSISISELANSCNVGRETVKRDLTKLKELNLIKRFGSDKKGYWELIK